MARRARTGPEGPRAPPLGSRPPGPVRRVWAPWAARGPARRRCCAGSRPSRPRWSRTARRRRATGGCRPGSSPWPGAPREERVRAVVAPQDLAIHAEDVHGQQHRLLMRLRPEHLVARPERGRGAGPVEHVGERAVPVDLHDLDLRPRTGEALAVSGSRAPPRARASARICRTPSGTGGARWSTTCPARTPASSWRPSSRCSRRR